MESNIALVRVASGFERLMVGSKGTGMLKDSTVAQISAALYYQAHVINKLTNNKQFKEAFKKTIFDQIMKDFGNYIDAKARTNPKSLHHVYEWKKVGNPSSRLFALTMIDGSGISFKIGYEFKESKSFVPTQKGRRKHVFKNKASVMEAGQPLVISPRNAQRLVFEVDGETVFTKNEVIVDNPGGNVEGQFAKAFDTFFSRYLSQSFLRISGLYDYFNNPVVYKQNLKKGKALGKSYGNTVGYNWVANAKVIR